MRGSASKRASTFITGAIGFTSALAGATTAIIAALYLVAPQLAPREKLGAELDRVSIAQGVHFDSFKAETSPGSKPAVDDPPENGVVGLVHANLSGFKDRSYGINVTAYASGSNGPVAMKKSEGGFNASCDSRSPRADEDGVAWRCWMVAPPRGVKYFVRAELSDSGLTRDLRSGPVTRSWALLDFLDSAEFTSLGP